MDIHILKQTENEIIVHIDPSPNKDSYMKIWTVGLARGNRTGKNYVCSNRLEFCKSKVYRFTDKKP